MEVEAAQTPAFVDPPAPSASPRRAHSSLYSFPPPSRSGLVDEYDPRGTASAAKASLAPARGEFITARHGEGNFSFTAGPPAPQTVGSQGSHSGIQQHYVDSDHRRYENSAQPRTAVDLDGLVDFDGTPLVRISSSGIPASATAYYHSSYQHYPQYASACGRSGGATSSPMQPVVSTMPPAGSEYTPHQPLIAHPRHHNMHVYQVPATSGAAPQPFAQNRQYTFGTASSTSTQPSAAALRVSYVPGPPGPRLEWAKPREPGNEAPITGSSAPSSHVARNSAAAPAPSRPLVPAAQFQPHPMYYSSCHPGELMLRTASNESGSSAYSEASDVVSEYERYLASINPAYIAHGKGADSGYYSSPQMSRSSEFARSTSSNELAGVAGLRIDRSAAVSSSHGPSTARKAPLTKLDSDQPIRGLRLNGASEETLRAIAGYSGGGGDDDEAAPVRGAAKQKKKRASSSGKASTNKRRVASNIFHPPPQAMLAPGAYSPSGSAIGARRGMPYATTQHTAMLPTDEEFRTLPTKRSRGRRPHVRSDGDGDGDGSGGEDVVDTYCGEAGQAPTAAQIAWVGTTKRGKPKKVFLCKVPGCGKCFKRSEHLKRHVRSIHTNERPFQCQWPTCKRLFSRHDNLNQHVRRPFLLLPPPLCLSRHRLTSPRRLPPTIAQLRIHREPGMTDEEFSSAIELFFGERLAEVQAERSWRGGNQSANESPETFPDQAMPAETMADGDGGGRDESYDVAASAAAVFGSEGADEREHQHEHGAEPEPACEFRARNSSDEDADGEAHDSGANGRSGGGLGVFTLPRPSDGASGSGAGARRRSAAQMHDDDEWTPEGSGSSSRRASTARGTGAAVFTAQGEHH